MFRSELDLWAMKVDQLKEYMKELGIFKGCSSLKKEALIEKIKEHQREMLGLDEKKSSVVSDEDPIESKSIVVNSLIDDDDDGEGSVDEKTPIKTEIKKRKFTPTKKEETLEYISPTKKEKLEINEEEDDDDILNSSIFDRIGLMTPPRSTSRSSIASSSQDVSPQPLPSRDVKTPPKLTTPTSSTPTRIVNRPIELPTSPPKSDEKRKRRFITKCPARIEQRIERALLQKLFLLERVIKNEHEQRFVVLGSTGNIYSVTICEESSCSCPDFEGGNKCKHILFIMLKVLRVEATSYLIYQNALLKGELECIFQRAPPTLPSVIVASSAAISQYKQMKGESIRHPLSSNTTCPICCDKFTTRREQTEADYCHDCGINVHRDCLQTWKGFNSDFPCPVCKSKTMGHLQPSQSHSQTSSSQRVRENEGYLNLSEFQPGIRKTRDTSTYFSLDFD